MKGAGNRPRCISSKLFKVCELGLKREAKKINTLRHCLPQEIWVAETARERLFAKSVTPEAIMDKTI